MPQLVRLQITREANLSSHLSPMWHFNHRENIDDHHVYLIVVLINSNQEFQDAYRESLEIMITVFSLALVSASASETNLSSLDFFRNSAKNGKIAR